MQTSRARAGSDTRAGAFCPPGATALSPEALIAWFGSLGFGLVRIGLEAGPLSQWLYAAMQQAGLAVELLETRHVRDAFKAMPVKSDRNDARGIAQLIRLGWFRPVHCKSLVAQEVRAFLTARKLVQSKLFDIARHHQAGAIISQRPGTVRVTNHAHKPLDISRKPRFTVVCRSEIHISLHPLMPESLRLPESDRALAATF